MTVDRTIIAMLILSGSTVWGDSSAENASAPSPSAESAMPEAVHEVLQKFCLDCHGTEEPSGGVTLSKVQSQSDVYHDGRVWNKVIRVTRDLSMPPKTEKAPSDAERQLLANWVESSLRSVKCESEHEPGRVTVRRLNRIEYENTLRDLLGVTVEAARDLPVDPAGNGFDNQGDTLFIPPVLMEKYLETTKRVLNEALAKDEAKQKLFVARPSDSISDSEAARAIFSKFLPRAFRRPVANEEINARVKVVEGCIARKQSFDDAIKVAAQSVLLSPYFLFRIEKNQAAENSTEPYRITDHELAVRLSYFLWSTMPDQELTDFADQGKLHEPEVLRVQVERMLADPKSISLSSNFASQWFGFRDMRSHEMDIRRFGGFNGVREDMYRESLTFFDSLFRENMPIVDVIDCNYAYLTEGLANHYGIPNVKGGEIRKVALPDRRRGGVLGMGSTLVVTSYPTRTSPIIRGKWVLEQILGTPPPPPPPNVKPVSQNDQMKDGMTLRQRLEKHRLDPTCASCHAKMDPIGFGLENYDGIGSWRDQDNGLAIDNTCVFPDGTSAKGPEGVKDALLARKDMFIRQFVEKMLIYALGRSVEYYDECTVRGTMERLAAHEYRSHEMIHSIVESYPFQHKRNSQ